MANNICKVEGKLFRYNREHAIVEYITKATDDMYEDNVEWQAKFGRDLWDIDEDGYFVMDSIGLMRESWDNKEVRVEYLTEWAWELEAEVNEIVEIATREFCKEA